MITMEEMQDARFLIKGKTFMIKSWAEEATPIGYRGDRTHTIITIKLTEIVMVNQSQEAIAAPLLSLPNTQES